MAFKHKVSLVTLVKIIRSGLFCLVNLSLLLHGNLFSEMVKLSKQLLPSAGEESEVLLTKMQAVRGSADAQVEKLQKVIMSWNELMPKLEGLETWVQENKSFLEDDTVDLASPQVAKLEIGLEKLKVGLMFLKL